MFWLISWLEHLFFTVIVAIAVRIYLTNGGTGLLKAAITLVKAVPGVEPAIQYVLRNEVTSFVKQMQEKNGKKSSDKPPAVTIPKKGQYADASSFN